MGDHQPTILKLLRLPEWYNYFISQPFNFIKKNLNLLTKNFFQIHIFRQHKSEYKLRYLHFHKFI